MKMPALAPVIFALLATTGPAFAQQPDGGELLREFRQLRPAAPAPSRLLTIPAAPVTLPAAAETTKPVRVTEFRFVGDLAEVDPAELEYLVQGHLGRTLSAGALQHIADDVARHLRAQGYSLARAVVPAQNLQDGSVQVAVLLGRIDSDATGNGIVIDAQGARISTARVRKTLALSTIAQSLYLKTPGMERGLLLLNELPGLAADLRLDPGSEPGTTRIAAVLDEGALWSGGGGVDNAGNRYAGDIRAHALLHLNNPSRHGDQAALYASNAQGVRGAELSYSLPLGHDGARAAVGYTRLDYELGKELRALNPAGNAQAAGLRLSYPFVRTLRFSLDGSAAYERKSIRDEMQGALQSNRRLEQWVLALDARGHGWFFDNGSTRLALALEIGRADLARLPAALAADALGPGTHGAYNKASYALSHLQPLTGGWSLHAALNGQFSDRNLDAAEKFVLGGAAGVRAYPAGEARGDSGWLSSLELRYALPGPAEWGDWQFSAFVDAGAVQLHREPWSGWDAASPGLEQHYLLSGTGLGISLVRPGSHTLRAMVARKLGSNPRRAAGAGDADGRHDSSRFWVQALLQF